MALVGSTYGLADRTLGAVSLLGPLRIDSTRRSAASPAPRTSSRARRAGLRRGLTRRTAPLLWRRRPGRLRRAPRGRARHLRRRDQDRVPPPCARTASGCERGSRRRGAVPSGSQNLRGAVEGRFAAALCPLRPRRPQQRRLPARDFDFAASRTSLSFFGDDLFGTSGRPNRSRGADIVAEVEVELVEAGPRAAREVVYGAAAACGRCGGGGAQPGTPVHTCPTSRARAGCRRWHGRCREFVRSSACTACAGAGGSSRPLRGVFGRPPVVEERSFASTCRGIHDGKRIRLTGEGHVGDGGGRAGGASRFGSVPTRVSCVRATTSS